MNSKQYESEAYSSGWIAGHDALVIAIHEGFDGNVPEWLLSVIGGKETVADIVNASDEREDEELVAEQEYDHGETDGYEELLGEVEEAFKERKTEMPMFLRQIVEG